LLVEVARRFGVALPFGEEWGSGHLWSAGLILGLVATANSPSTAVAVINETRSKGPVTTVALGVTVIKDVLVIVLMAVTLTVTTRLVGVAAAEGSAWWVVAEIAFSLVVGTAVGGALIFYLARVNREVALAVLVTVFLTIEGSELFHRAFGLHLHFILVCVTAGFVVENASERGRELIRGLARTSLPVYVIFFMLSGVGLDLGALDRLWPVALFFVLWRGALMWLTTWGGARLAGSEAAVVRYSWTAFLAQAGISLGLAELVGERFPEIGGPLKTLVLAVVAVNQIVGPILFKLSLQKAGETGRVRDDG
jgi:Kef-type K+ transport system membrane component KefB